MSLYSRLARPLLFSLDAETAHNLTLAAVSNPVGRAFIPRLPAAASDPRLAQRLFGLDFANPVGLAAGLDKQGTAIPAWMAMGFGFAEVGTVTPRPQPGNQRPRLFRLPADEAIINRFGFNSAGARAVARNLAKHPPRSMQLGVNIGRNKDTPNEAAARDYVACVEALRQHADYLAINVSSPNTANLRDLQASPALRDLVGHVVNASDGVPVLVKISPDMAEADLLSALDAAAEGGASGVVATNTTMRRERLVTSDALAAEPGGLSGKPLRAAATATCRAIFRRFRHALPIVGVGGIFTADDAYERIRAGASLIQIYSALVYEGPALASQLLQGLITHLERDGFTTITQAVGIDVR